MSFFTLDKVLQEIGKNISIGLWVYSVFVILEKNGRAESKCRINSTSRVTEVNRPTVLTCIWRALGRDCSSQCSWISCPVHMPGVQTQEHSWGYWAGLWQRAATRSKLVCSCCTPSAGPPEPTWEDHPREGQSVSGTTAASERPQCSAARHKSMYHLRSCTCA